ncbi:MAG: thioesterase family protein [Marinobacter sp.]|uniref:acyl-CoA thioesterase n=1 Tax=Marinobacter sp. TaxID=50741 RepID=UPI00299EBB61|nr:thioesterase family protein [Marinobacter sp.]MDX1755789.1 thioesterase family protein [Marinobacter sp.]
MQFDELLAGLEQESLVLPSSWGQGRATFGGLVAALVTRRMQQVVAEGRPLRSLQVSFVGPVAVEQPVRIEVELLREGRAVSQVQGRVVQDGEVKVVVLASFGGDRASQVSVAPDRAPEVAAPDQLQSLPYMPNLSPEFVQHIEMRWGFGGLPFSGQTSREMGGWMKFRKQPEAMSDAHLVALIDAWPPAVLPHLTQPAPASSLSWTLEFVYPRPALAADDWLLYRASIDQAGAGYGHTQARIWSPGGELVAISRQTVTVFG